MHDKIRRIVFPLMLCLSLTLTCCGNRVPTASSGQTVNPEAESGKLYDSTASKSAAGEGIKAVSGDEVIGLIPSMSDGWTICWYLCGSNLESFYGCASADLEEAAAVELPDNVRVVIQTGGAHQWRNETVSAGVIQRYLLDSSGLRLIDERPEADMGDAETLASYLTFCNTYFPSAHSAVVFWNHGGGSVSGAEFDEVYGFDSLTLSEFEAAFAGVYDLSEEYPPVDLIGFDACLMATVDVANTFQNTAHWLVASEEVEPGCGWDYTGWLQALADQPDMTGDELGKAICDSYLAGCAAASTESEVTLSVTDLSRIGPLLEAYDALGNEALLNALNDPGFYPAFGREAACAENYGGNTPEQGYTNMVDLGHLTRNCRELLPQNAQAVLDALDNCVVYRVSGAYRTQASGLSCYYSFNGDLKDFVGYTDAGASEPFKYLYAYGLSGKLSSTGEEYVRALTPGSTAPDKAVPALDDFDLSSAAKTYVDESGYPVLKLDPKLAAALREVRVRVRQAYLVSTDPQRVDIVSWGESDLVGRDWEKGIFRAYFDGLWATLDGAALYMEVVYSSDEYTLYSSPVLLNGKLCNLQISYEKTITALEGGSTMSTLEWHILGAREGIDAETGMADKNLILLQPGDEIIPVYLALQNAGARDSAWEQFYQPENAVYYSDEADLDLLTDFGTGVYDIEFELVDSRNQKASSDRFMVAVTPYEVSVQLWDDYIADKGTAVTRWR